MRLRLMWGPPYVAHGVTSNLYTTFFVATDGNDCSQESQDHSASISLLFSVTGLTTLKETGRC